MNIRINKLINATVVVCTGYTISILHFIACQYGSALITAIIVKHNSEVRIEKRV